MTEHGQSQRSISKINKQAQQSKNIIIDLDLAILDENDIDAFENMEKTHNYISFAQVPMIESGQHFSTHFMNLMNQYDHEHLLDHHTRISMYEDLIYTITSDDSMMFILDDILESLRAYCNELKSSNNYYILHRFENKFRQWMYIPARTIYYNPQNVHMFMTPATQAAMEIMSKYPCTYTGRPFDHSFFDIIETDELVNGIHLPTLFASIWMYIKTHKERESLINRLLEEMNESDDMCVSGHMIRLINSVKGFDDDFEFNLEHYEYNKARIFNQLNKLLDVTVLDGFLDRIEDVVNSSLDVNGIDEKDVLSILRDYSKHEWIRNNKRYMRVLTQ